MSGIPAFPVHAQCGEETGMSLRDYFAAKVLQGVVAKSYDEITPNNVETICKVVYRIADAMLKERAK